MRRRNQEIIMGILPAIIFYAVYKMISYQCTLIIGILIGLAIYSYKYKKFRKMSSMDKVGIFGLVMQTGIGLIAENPKTYFIYPIITNLVFASVIWISLLMKTDAISYIARDFTESEDVLKLLKPVYRKLTLMWGLYYTLKMFVKVVGLMKLSFEQLYAVNWVLGMPVSMLLLMISFTYPNKYYKIIKEKGAI